MLDIIRNPFLKNPHVARDSLMGPFCQQKQLIYSAFISVTRKKKKIAEKFGR